MARDRLSYMDSMMIAMLAPEMEVIVMRAD